MDAESFIGIYGAIVATVLAGWQIRRERIRIAISPEVYPGTMLVMWITNRSSRAISLKSVEMVTHRRGGEGIRLDWTLLTETGEVVDRDQRLEPLSRANRSLAADVLRRFVQQKKRWFVVTDTSGRQYARRISDAEIESVLGELPLRTGRGESPIT